jgi:hypothetical protein
MIIAKESTHFYDKQGNPVYEVPNKSKGGMRPTTKRDAKKLDLAPSVTVISNLLAKPALEAWKLNQILLSAATTPHSRDSMAADEWIEIIKAESKEQAEQAKEKGIKKHAEIEQFFKERTKPDNKDTQSQIHQIANGLLEDYNIYIEDIQPEKSFYSPLFGGFGGKMDLPAIEKNFIADIKTTEFTLVDGVPHKNGKKAKLHWDEHLIQICGYALGNNLIHEYYHHRKETTLINIYVSTLDDSVFVHEWNTEEKMKGSNIFQKLTELWYLLNNF